MNKTHNDGHIPGHTGYFFLEVILEVNYFMIHGRKFFDQTIKDDIKT